MRFLRLPEGIASVSVMDQTFGADQFGVIAGPDGKGVEDHIAREIMGHDPRITEFVPESADDPRQMPGAGDRRVAFLSRVATLDRTELFAAGRSMQVSLPATLSSERLREILIKHAATVDEDQLPMLVGARSPAPEGGIVMLTGADALSPNRGNDGLGASGPLPGSVGPGSTFSQASLVPHPDAAAKPAPSGLGPVQATGTQQPPFNQLSTDTGKPANDVTRAPFPISVPPIDPLTGQPFAEGDPRIPATALPIERQGRQPADAFHAAVDEHETLAAVAISEATDRLTDTLGAGRPLLTPAQEADRLAGLAAADKGKTDPEAKLKEAARAAEGVNHGNDGEGKKPTDAPIKN